MKILLANLCFLLLESLSAQVVPGSPDPAERFPAIDARARQLALPDGDIIRLTDSLTTPYPTEVEKARAIFSWIAFHIDYDCGNENRLLAEPDSAVHPLYYTRQQLQNILRTRRTRCEGFSFLFRLMCRLSGIYCTQLEGYARFDGKPANPATVQPNHTWNAALLDGEWYEIDPTAGAGSCAGRRYRPMLRDAYFRMSTALLAQQYIAIEDSRRTANQGRIILKFQDFR